MTQAPPRPRAPLRPRPQLPPDLDPRRGHRRGARRDRPSGALRLTRTLAVILSCVVLATSVGGWVAYSYFNGKIRRLDVTIGGKQPPAAPLGTQNYLLVGTDSRAGTGSEYGGSTVEGQRSDTTILAHLDKDGSSTLLSIPRDTLVTIPEYTSKDGTVHPAHRAKFNEAITDGGPALLWQTVQQLTAVKVDHYVAVDLAGFKAITNAIGGVQVCIKANPYVEGAGSENGYRQSTNINDPMSGFVGRVGTNTLNGDMALAFVRQRHGLLASDIGRIQRQQQFLGAVFRKAMSGGVLGNPVKLEGLLSSSASALTLVNTQLADLKSLASHLKGLNASKMRFETLPVHTATRAEGAYDDQGDIQGLGAMQVIDPAAAAAILDPVRGSAATIDPQTGIATITEPGATTGGAGGSTQSDGSTGGGVVSPAQVNVAVYNGTGTAGLASRATSALEGVGFSATNAGNALVKGYAASRVVYGTGSAAAAALVRSAVPGSTLVSDPTITGVQLIVGSTWTGATTPSTRGTLSTGGTGSTAPATPSPAATTPPAPTAASVDCTY